MRWVDTPTYCTWKMMRRRCNDPKHKSYKDYGARGIKVCDRWQTSFQDFLADMGERPEGKTLDRIKSHLGYFKENCKWSTSEEQNNNQRMRCTNTSGITGVVFKPKRLRYHVIVQQEGKPVTLYWGPDFFEACCRRKSWETS